MFITGITRRFEKSHNAFEWSWILRYLARRSHVLCWYYPGICQMGPRRKTTATREDRWRHGWYWHQLPLNTCDVLCCSGEVLFSHQLAVCNTESLHKYGVSFSTAKKKLGQKITPGFGKTFSLPKHPICEIHKTAHHKVSPHAQRVRNYTWP
jgi:hypothetical protein